MKNIYFLIFFLLMSCTNINRTYLCGDRECLDKKEYKSYFEKNLVIEMKISSKNKSKKTIDLVVLNSNQKIKSETKKEIFFKTFTNTEKQQIKEQKKLLKLKRKEAEKFKKNKTKNERKKAKKLIKITKAKNKEKNKSQTLISSVQKKKDNIQSKQKGNNINTNNNKICVNVEDCEIDKITNLLLKKGTDKDFPDITSK
ncbi:MAG: hypothetical protein FD544_000280 [Pelagibacterales bacterium]|nr:hypothetical protein [Pelagibacterales bacterium]